MTETERVYRQLKADILSGVYPPGTALRQEELAAHTGSSRTPVREAIIMLSAERLVQMKAGLGATVRELPVREFVELNQVREILESAAAAMAAAKVPDDVLAELCAKFADLRANRATDTHAIAAFDQEVHRTIAQYCGNSHMQRMIEDINALNVLARMRDIEIRNVEMVASLGEMVQALQNRSGEQLARLMRSHIHDFSRLLPSLLNEPTQVRS